MPVTTKRQLARLRARFETVARQLGQLGFLLKGSVVQSHKRCSSAGCGCQTDPEKRHGPYWQWTGKVHGKMTTRALSEEQLARYREWMENARHLEALVQQLYEISSQANELLRALERQTPEPTERTPRPRARA